MQLCCCTVHMFSLYIAIVVSMITDNATTSLIVHLNFIGSRKLCHARVGIVIVRLAIS